MLVHILTQHFNRIQHFLLSVKQKCNINRTLHSSPLSTFIRIAEKFWSRRKSEKAKYVQCLWTQCMTESQWQNRYRILYKCGKFRMCFTDEFAKVVLGITEHITLKYKTKSSSSSADPVTPKYHVLSVISRQPGQIISLQISYTKQRKLRIKDANSM